MAQAVRSPLISIPDEVERFADFRTRVIGLLAGKDTHVYIDTSFLMWLTKIGSGSRQELFAWLRKNCLGRVHVPIWAAHEYLKHYVAGTIANDLADKTSELADLVGRTYAYFRPFVDEPVSPGAEDPSTIRAETRSALTSLARLTRIGRQWQKSYQKHSAEVITFINASIPDGTSIYDDLQLIAATGAVRFAGSVPPGFEDRHKKGSAKEAESYAKDDTPVGSNRYGDLSFWREVLAVAMNQRAVGEQIALVHSQGLGLGGCSG